VSDRQPSDSTDPRFVILAAEFAMLDAEDQDLVLDFVARLRGASPEPFADQPFHDPDVPFMDFGG